jgi:hypothetical protein
VPFLGYILLPFAGDAYKGRNGIPFLCFILKLHVWIYDNLFEI